MIKGVYLGVRTFVSLTKKITRNFVRFFTENNPARVDRIKNNLPDVNWLKRGSIKVKFSFVLHSFSNITSLLPQIKTV